MGIWFKLIIPTFSQHLQTQTIPFMLEVILVGTIIFLFPTLSPVCSLCHKNWLPQPLALRVIKFMIEL